MFCTYILQSEKDGSFYIGYTQQLQKRIHQHNNGKSNYSAKHRPFKLVYYEKLDSKQEALAREEYFKTAQGREFFLSKL